MTTAQQPLLSRAGAAAAYAAAAHAHPGSVEAKARNAAQKFEGVLMNSLLGTMFQGASGEGPLGVNGTGGEAWRSLLIEQMANSVVKSGGIGIAAQVYRDVMNKQERHA